MADQKEKIYIADDDDNIRELIKTFLQSEGYHVIAFSNGEELLAYFIREACDLVVLDVMMPGRDGFAICTEIRKISTVPIIFLTAKDTDLDYATGLNLGSDDYFTKPFSAMSLVMRVKAIFRRIGYERQNVQPSADSGSLTFSDILINEKSKAVTIAGQDVPLTPNEYGLLSFLVRNSDRAVSRDELLEAVWGFEAEIETRAADDTIRRLRKKMTGSNVIIDAVWGFGFRLKVDEHE